MRGNLQKVMIGLVVVIVLAFIFFSGDSLVKLVDTIKQGTPFFIIAAGGGPPCPPARRSARRSPRPPAR